MSASYIDPQIPFIDLHRHLDGNVRLKTILDLGRRHGLNLPAWEPESLRPHIQVTEPQAGVMAFIEKFYWLTQILVDYDACRRIAFENVEDARAEGLDYVELRFSPTFMAEAHGLDPVGVVEAVCEGVNEGRVNLNQPVNLIGIISRTYGVEAGYRELFALTQFRDQIAGLDLAGDEANFPAVLFKDHFRQARNLGWGVTVHAGESAGPESIWQAINDLGASRIGHAVAAVQDPGLIAQMKEQKIGIECNLTSNVQTSTVPDYASHPLRQFLEKGLLATINTDDPAISGVDLKDEFRAAVEGSGLSPEQTRQAQVNALETAFLSEEEKTGLIEKKKRAGSQ